MTNLDKIDLSILKNIQKNGRVTNIELAGIAGISAPPCLRRLKAMEKNEIIIGYHAKINPIKMGFNFHGIAVVKLSLQNAWDVTSFVNSMTKVENVRSCFSTLGGEDFILDIIAEDIQSYENLIQTKIQTEKNVSSIKTYIVINKYKEEFGIPI